jgi:hypothetical protein
VFPCYEGSIPDRKHEQNMKLISLKYAERSSLPLLVIIASRLENASMLDLET